MINQSEIYVSTDIEVDGPIPGPHSMLSFGSAAMTSRGEVLSGFSANLQALPEAKGHPSNMTWWEQHPDAWAACRSDLQEPEKAMKDYVHWLKKLPGKPIFVGYPAVFDFMFIYWYLIKFVGESPFEHSAIDIRTYSMAILKRPYHLSGKVNMPERWLEEEGLNHVAIEDAIQQGRIFCRMLAEKNYK